MSDFTEKLRRVPLFLERIGIVGRSDNFDIVRGELPFLSFTLRWNQRATHHDRCPGAEPLDRRVIRQRVSRNDLEIA